MATTLLVVASVATGCGVTSTDHPPTLEPLTEVFFPRMPRDQRPTNHPTALGSGLFVLDDDCLWMISPGSRHLLIWSDADALELVEGAIVVTEEGLPVARVGETILVSGGEINMAEAPDAEAAVEASIGQPIPAACRLGAYWRVGTVQPRTTP